MAVKKATRSQYSAMVKAVRKYATGFNPDDGYDLTDFANWSKHRRKQVRDYFETIRELTSRDNYLFRPRREDHLRVAQAAADHPADRPRLKVAFIPYTAPMTGKREQNATPPKIKISKGALIVEGPYHTRTHIPFDPVALAENTWKETMRAAHEADKAKVFTIQAGIHEIHGQRAHDPGALVKQITALMARYDGIKPIPETSGNRGNDPAHHHWSKWLTGINAYTFKKGGTLNRLDLDHERHKNERKRQARRDKLAKAKRRYS